MASILVRRKVLDAGRRLHGVVALRAVSGATGVPNKTNIKEKDVSGVASIPSEADVVVIGGGIVGCSALYHLAKLGVTNAILLEAHKLTAGTTWHTAGLMHLLNWSETDFLLKNITYKLLLGLQEETGVDPGWNSNGSMYIASKKTYGKQRRYDFQRLVTMGRVCGLEGRLLEPSQIKEIYPLMNVQDLECAVYHTLDGSMDPSGLCEALIRSAKRAGSLVVEHCPVTDVRTVETSLGGRRVSEVHTPLGVIKTSALINASGAWANDICSKVGVHVPLAAFRHGYVVTEGIPGIENMPNFRDYNASYYVKPQGDALTIGGFEKNPVPIEKLDPDFPFGLYEPDWDIVSDLLQEAAIRLPVLENTGIKSTVYGPESFTPDNKPVVG